MNRKLTRKEKLAQQQQAETEVVKSPRSLATAPKGPVATLTFLQHVFVCLGIAFTIFLLYGNSLSNEWGLDDELVIYNNARTATGLEGVPRVWKEHYVDDGNARYGYRPVTSTTFQFEYARHGAEPFYGHLYSILLYVLNCVLVYLLMVRMFRRFHWLLPLTIILLFIAHPLHSEVVLNIKSRDELLAFFFGFMAFGIFLIYGDTRKWYLIPLGLGALVVGFFAKQSMAALFLIIPLALHFFTELKRGQVLMLTSVLLLMFVALFFGNKMFLDQGMALDVIREFKYFENPIVSERLGFAQRLPMGGGVTLYNLGLFLFPYPLLCYYGFTVIDVEAWGWSSPIALIGLVLMLAMFVVSLRYWKQKSIWVFFLLFTLVSLGAVSNIIKPLPGVVAERFMYLPSLGLCMLLGWGVMRALQAPLQSAGKYKNLVAHWFVMLLLVIPAAVVVAKRVPDWKDQTTLFDRDADAAEQSTKLHALAGGHMLKLAQREESPQLRDAIVKKAISHLEQAIAIYPGYYKMHNNLGFAKLFFYAQFDAAAVHFRDAIRNRDEYPDANYNLGFCFDKMGQLDSAAHYYGRAIEYQEDYILSYQKIFPVLMKSGRHDEAIALQHKALGIFEYPREFYINLGDAHQYLKQPVDAIGWYEKAFEQGPEAVLAQHLYNLNRQIGDTLIAGGWAQEYYRLGGQ